MSYRVRGGLDARRIIRILAVAAIAAMIAAAALALYIHRPGRAAGDAKTAATLPAEIAGAETVLLNLTARDLPFEGSQPVKTPRWSAIRRDYPDAVAWITVPDTEIAFPVVRGDAAAPYLDPGNDPDFFDPNTVIHGRCDAGGAMEALLNYGDGQYFADHPRLYVTVGDKQYEYTVYAVFEADSENLLTAHNCYDFGAFTAYVDQVYACRSMNANFEPDLRQQVLDTWQILTLQADNGSGKDYYLQAVLTGGGVTAVGGVRVTPDYAGVTDFRLIATAALADETDPVGEILSNYVRDANPGRNVSPARDTGDARDANRARIAGSSGQVFGPYRHRMYRNGVPVWDGFGTFVARYGLGNTYDGRTATVYRILRDGTVTEETLTVERGKLPVGFDEMASIMIVLDE